MKNSKTDRRRVPVTDEEPPRDFETATATDPAESQRAENADPVAGLQADLDRFRDLALRSQADFDNFKKRAAREKEEATKYANSSLLERLIAIVDNFELGLAAARSEGEKSPIYSGMSMVLKQLSDYLTENGLQPIDAEGQKFDPNLHEAIAHEPSADVPEGIVVRQMRRGYKMKDRLLRPSAVVVSSGPAA
ncbi:MAG TPA: nucleotide exchange factor GrpE [Chthoniobacterales bacterium]